MRRDIIHIQMDRERLRDLQSNLQDGIERRHWLLEDHRDMTAADLAHLLVREPQELPAIQAN